MIDIEFKIDADPKNNYGKAVKLLLETDNAMQALTTQERDKLIRWFLHYKGMLGLYQKIQRYLVGEKNI